MRRILIVGNSGGGKSTLARVLGERLGLPVIHLDVLFWKPNWVEREKAEFRARMTEALADDEWICDGNFGDSWDIRMPLADTIIWIDQPRLRCLFRAIRRALTCRGGGRTDLAQGCRETIDLQFYHFIWTYDAKVRPKLEQAFVVHAPNARIVRLQSDREVAKFVAGVTK